ncbi:MAG: saccharopine dehydrogenase NADP-binding domain-containing protein [Actinomycetota bacterium]
MRIAVVGGGGAMGSITAADAARSEGVSAVTIIDVDPDRENRPRSDRSSAEGVAIGVEIAPDRAARRSALEGHDVVVNAASHTLNVEVMEDCLAIGANYVDLGGFAAAGGNQHDRAIR